jgi:thiol-disulfide isomerase/thioredoxin
VLRNGDREGTLSARSRGGITPPGDLLTSRRTVLGGMIGTTVSLMAGAAAAAEDISIPSFESGRYQFTILRPQIEIPPIRLFGLDGKTIDLSSLRGKPILLNFWATWCAACRTELPILDRLLGENRGIAVDRKISDFVGPDKACNRFPIASVFPAFAKDSDNGALLRFEPPRQVRRDVAVERNRHSLIGGGSWVGIRPLRRPTISGCATECAVQFWRIGH